MLHVTINTFVTAEVKAENIKKALEKAEQMSIQKLWDALGAKKGESHKITGIFES